MVQAEGATLQHLKTKPLTLISIYIHCHDCKRQLSCVFYLETLSDGEKWLVGAQAYGNTNKNVESFTK